LGLHVISSRLFHHMLLLNFLICTAVFSSDCQHPYKNALSKQRVQLLLHICTFLQAHLGGSWMRDRGESVHLIEFPAAAPRAQKQHRRYCVLHMHLSAKREHLTETDAFSLNSRNGVAGSSRQHFRRLSSRAPPTWPLSSRKLILSAQVCHTCSCLNGGSVCCV